MKTALIAIFGLIGASAAGFLISYFGLAVVQRDAIEGWRLVATVVAADEIPAGTVITYDLISQRAIPSQFVAASIIRPEEANKLVGEVVSANLQAGDPIHWNQLVPGVAKLDCASRCERIDAMRRGQTPVPQVRP